MNPRIFDPVFLEMFGRRKGSVLDRYALYRIWGELMNEIGSNRMKFSLLSFSALCNRYNKF